MKRRIDVRMIAGQHYACMEDLLDDAVDEYNKEGITPENARCALTVARWFKRLIEFHDKHDRTDYSLPETHPRDFTSRGSNELWRAHNRGKQ